MEVESFKIGTACNILKISPKFIQNVIIIIIKIIYFQTINTDYKICTLNITNFIVWFLVKYYSRVFHGFSNLRNSQLIQYDLLEFDLHMIHLGIL